MWPARSMEHRIHGLPLRSLSVAVGATTVASLPVFVVGSLAVLMQVDLDFDAQGLGVAVAAFYGFSALLSIPGGRLAERWGSRRTVLLANTTTAAAMGAVGLWATSLGHLVVLLVVAGIANGFTQPAVNLGLSRLVRPDRQGTAFGVKQAAIPVATLVSGLAVPLVGLTVGWRWAWSIGSLMLVAVILAGPRDHPDPAVRSVARASVAEVPSRLPLLLLAISAGFGAGAANCLGAFLVTSAVGSGVREASAGYVFAAGSASAIIARVVVGWLADRHGGGLALVSLLMLGGGAAFAVLSVGPTGMALAAATVLAFAGGWGWAGLLTFRIVQLYPDRPAAATGVQQAGVFTGGVVAPLVFGAIVVRWGFSVAWLVGGIMYMVAAVHVHVARMLIGSTVRYSPG